MAYRDLQDYLQDLMLSQDLHRITVEVDPVLEITEIANRMVKAGGPALLFEKVRGSNFPLVANLFGTLRRTCRALGVETLDDIAARIRSYLPQAFPSSLSDKLKLLLRLKDLAGFRPKIIRSAPSQQIVETPGDVTTLPVLHCWPKDAGRFITLPLVITKHPDTGIQNMGMYRIQIIDSRNAIVHWHVHHDGAFHHRRYKELGKPMDIAVALGCDPATIYAATAPLPSGVDELLFAGFLRHEPVETVPAVTVDLLVPAHAEFVIEGKVHCTETRIEGPFGDHTGFYSPADYYPLFEITVITRKRNPVYPATIVGRPLMEDYFLGKATERIFLPLIQLQLPEIVDINFPAAGVFHNCVLVSIKKSFPGHARKVASALWGMGQMMLTKSIIIVDADVDVQNIQETAWIVFSNVDPERDIFIVKGPLDVLDHASPQPLYGSKIAIDATRTWPEEGYGRQWPEQVAMDASIVKRVTERWKEYGFA